MPARKPIEKFWALQFKRRFLSGETVEQIAHDQGINRRSVLRQLNRVGVKFECGHMCRASKETMVRA